MAASAPAAEPEKGFNNYWHWVRVLIAVTVIAGAAWLLYAQLKHVGTEKILDGVRSVPAWKIWTAVGLTALNYLILVGYDWAATRYVEHPLSLRRIAFASFICYAMSHNFGWIIGGPASRYRLYSAAKLTTLEIVKLVTILAVAYWMGFFALTGVVFVAFPPDLPTELRIDERTFALPVLSARPLGIVFVTVVCSYLAATAFVKKVELRGKELKLPSFRLSLFLVAVAMLDIMIASTVLYALLPPEMSISLPMATSVYLMGMVVVITLHIPGGVGVFEAVVLALLAPADPAQLGELAGVLIVYRAVYYLLPLLIASLALVAHEVWILRQKPAS